MAGTEGLATSTDDVWATNATGVKSPTGSKGREADSAALVECALDATRSVCPSGDALATVSVPILLAAPGLFSITTGRPSAAAIRSPTTRPRASTRPPGGQGTTIRTVRDG